MTYKRICLCTKDFQNDLMMLMGNLMQWKFRIPLLFKKILKGMTEKTVHEACTKKVWKADDIA